MKTNEPQIKDGMLLVCGWCYPRETVFEAFPQLPRLPLSHGICPACKHKVLADVLKQVKP